MPEDPFVLEPFIEELQAEEAEHDREQGIVRPGTHSLLEDQSVEVEYGYNEEDSEYHLNTKHLGSKIDDVLLFLKLLIRGYRTYDKTIIVRIHLCFQLVIKDYIILTFASKAY